MSPRRWAVVTILLAALALRLALVEATPGYRPIGDARFYASLASGMARTGDYAVSGGAGGTRGSTAYFPPAYPYFLAAIDVLDGRRGGGQGSVRPALVVQAVLGTVTVALVGLVAFELFGPVVGLVALVLAAVYVPWIALGGTLMSENLLVALELGALWAALRARRATRGSRAAWITLAGVLAGLSTLTHENAVVLLVPLALAVSTSRPRWSRAGLLAPLTLLAAAALTIAPWTIRNAVVMHRLIPVADENGVTLLGTYNPVSAADRRIPYGWRYFSNVPLARARHLTEPELGADLEAAAFRYIGAHPLAPLEVAYHNTRRLLELEGTFAWKAAGEGIGIKHSLLRLGVVWFWLMAALAVLGGVTARAREAPRWLWLVPLLLYLSVVFVNAETPRFRAPLDPFLLLLAALALAGQLPRVLRDRLT
jgi:4-amino-4-deoxy-L-arabinose transferase-like glycosyltransferase